LWWWVGGQEGGSVVLCAWCEERYLTQFNIEFHNNLCNTVTFTDILFHFISQQKNLEYIIKAALISHISYY
jgi:hypothetical protein